MFSDHHNFRENKQGADVPPPIHLSMFHASVHIHGFGYSAEAYLFHHVGTDTLIPHRPGSFNISDVGPTRGFSPFCSEPQGGLYNVNVDHIKTTIASHPPKEAPYFVYINFSKRRDRPQRADRLGCKRGALVAVQACPGPSRVMRL